ncbi:MAG: ABC transporter ATP-binding protein [Alphaproteobacteria bacterium]|nr:ABC transporter ATP-binding protein [Alphaproteobacteria bacterium]
MPVKPANVTRFPQERPTPVDPGGAPELALDIQGLCKTYPGTKRTPAKRALQGIDLQVRRGELFGLLGPNGAGKSTLINILAGLVVKSAGVARVWGIDIDRDPRNARAAIGVVPQELSIDAYFTPRETLELQAGMYGVPTAERRTDAILEAVGLADKAHAYARSLSGGMRRRLLVAKAMVHNPPILVLDEPSAGVDVELRRKLWDNIRALNAGGVTVLLTTHYLEEAQELCDRIAIIDHGAVIACDTTRDLVGRLDRKELYVAVEERMTVVPAALAALGFALGADGRLHVAYAKAETKVSRLIGAVQAAGLHIADLETRESDLEDVFLTLTTHADTTGDGSAEHAA